MKGLTTLLLLLLFLNCACNKEGNTSIDVSEITSTDFWATPLGAEDKTDWTSDNIWSDQEKALFVTPPDSLLKDAETAIVSVFPAYSNPTAYLLRLTIQSSKNTVCEVVFTDRNLIFKERFFLKLEKGYPTNLFKLNEATYSNNTNYRLYYGFYSSTNILYYKGHGDIQVKR